MGQQTKHETDKTSGEAIPEIPFNVPTMSGEEMDCLADVLSDLHCSSSGRFTDEAERLLLEMIGAKHAYLTTSGSSALEMAALLADVEPGDEILMPSWTFVTTASAFALRGAVPVFVDIKADTQNIDESLVAEAITSKTRAIVPVHYAGGSCAMDSLSRIAADHDLLLIEDAAQALLSSFRDRPLGSIGAISIFSFHAAKNINCGEGGAVLVNDEKLHRRAQVIWDKGTNKQDFLDGKVHEYSWCELSSSFAPSEYSAALLVSQLRKAREVTRARLEIWHSYHAAFEELEEQGHLIRPGIERGTTSNGHIYYLIVSSDRERDMLIGYLRSEGICAQFHYSPLHLSPAGRRYGRAHGNLRNTETISRRIVRLPLYQTIDQKSVNRVIDGVRSFYNRQVRSQGQS